MAAPPTYSHPASSDRSQDSAILNGEVRLDFIRDGLRRQPLTDHSLLTDRLMHFTHKYYTHCGYEISRIANWMTVKQFLQVRAHRFTDRQETASARL